MAWKISRWSEKFPGGLESFQVAWKVSIVAWKVSVWSEKFPGGLEKFHVA